MLNTFGYHPGKAAAEALRAYNRWMQPILSDAETYIVATQPTVF